MGVETSDTVRFEASALQCAVCGKNPSNQAYCNLTCPMRRKTRVTPLVVKSQGKVKSQGDSRCGVAENKKLAVTRTGE